MKDTVGVDISKARLDAFSRTGDLHRQFGNDRRGIADLMCWLDKLGRPLVVFEATGAYHRTLEASLGANGFLFCKVNPRQSRRFAEATGRLAKTDRVDAATLARMGAVLDLPAQPPCSENLHELRELLVARRALMKDQTAAKTRARTARQTLIRRMIAARLRLIRGQLAEIDRVILERIDADPEPALPLGHAQGRSSHTMSNHDPAAFAMAEREAGFFGFGFCPRVDFIHIDLGPKRKWGERFAPRPAYRDALR